MDDRSRPRDPPRRGKRVRRVGAVVAILVLLVFGARWVERESGEDPPLSYATEEAGLGCSSITYVPARSVARVRRHPPPKDWKAFQRQPGAKFIGGDIVRVAVQAGSVQELTMTGIRFSAERRPRPGGAAFAAPCIEAVTGRGFAVDVEAEPPRLMASSADGGGSFSPIGLSATSVHPVAFPWTVSLAESLRFSIVASARSCYCVWTAEIPWVSGDERGVIRVDNGGRGYTVIGIDGLSSFSPAQGKWEQLRVAHAHS